MSFVDTPIFTGVNLHLPSGGGSARSTTWTLWQVPGNQPSRVESVSFLASYPDGTQHEEVWVLQLLGQNGALLWSQSSPQMSAGSQAWDAEYLTWARGSTGNDQFAANSYAVVGLSGGTGIWTGPLPEFVLQSLGYVNLTLHDFSDGGLPQVNITNVEISYTPSGAGTAQIAAVGVPLLTDATP